MALSFQTKFLSLFTCAVTLCFMAQSAPTAPPARALVTQSIDTAKLFTLSGNTRSEAIADNDRGKVADTFPMNHMMLQLQRSPEREAALKIFIDQQHDSKSPNFHKWLTAQEFGQLYGPSEQDIEKVSTWLRSAGFTVHAVYPSKLTVDFSGTAGQVATAFHTEIHQLSVNGKSHIANMSDPKIPEALAPAIAGIVSLHDFFPHRMIRPRTQYTFAQDGFTYQAVVPADLATIYDLNKVFAAGYTGKGQTIAVVEDSDLYTTDDWNTFRSAFGLNSFTSGSLVTVNPPPTSGVTNCTDPGSNENDVETAADAEWSTAAAPNATIWVATCSDTMTFGGLIATENMINSGNPPQIISMSYGECEAGNGAASNATFNSAFQQAVSEGISVFVAAGDSGAAACDGDLGYTSAVHGIGVSAYASTPYNVAVGGTDFADTYEKTSASYWSSSDSSAYGSALSYVPEIPWNDSCAGSLLTQFTDFSVGYGLSGLCGSAMAQQDLFVGIGAGAGGPSGCATGTPATLFVVGGSCQGYAKPSWQTGVSGIPGDGVRDIPDVAMFAATGLWGHYYVTCYSDPTYPQNGGEPCVGTPDNWSGAGGTSFASPVMAGIQALVNERMGDKQGNPNPVYYKLAASSEASSVFHSITKGDIAVTCGGSINCFGASFVGRGRSTPVTAFDGDGALSTTTDNYTPAFAAASGYSLATGLGSVDGFNLVMNWSKGQ